MQLLLTISFNKEVTCWSTLHHYGQNNSETVHCVRRVSGEHFSIKLRGKYYRQKKGNRSFIQQQWTNSVKNMKFSDVWIWEPLGIGFRWFCRKTGRKSSETWSFLKMNQDPVSFHSSNILPRGSTWLGKMKHF